MIAISGSFALLTNPVMTWSTQWLQRCLGETSAGRGPISIERVTPMAPIAHRHINFNGELRFMQEEADVR